MLFGTSKFETQPPAKQEFAKAFLVAAELQFAKEVLRMHGEEHEIEDEEDFMASLVAIIAGRAPNKKQGPTGLEMALQAAEKAYQGEPTTAVYGTYYADLLEKAGLKKELNKLMDQLVKDMPNQKDVLIRAARGALDARLSTKASSLPQRLGS